MTAPTVVAPPAVTARHRSWRPALGTPRRVFDPTFSGSGLTVPAWFFALSLLPSLLPRGAMVQGVASGVTVLIGYGIGAGTQAIWRYLGIPSVRGRARRVLVAIFVGLGLWAAVFTGWRQVGWQNEIRTLYGMVGHGQPRVVGRRHEPTGLDSRADGGAVVRPREAPYKDS